MWLKFAAAAGIKITFSQTQILLGDRLWTQNSDFYFCLKVS